MGLTSETELHELLLIEEADAWFEYADATKDRGRLAVRRDRAVGVGAPAAAAAHRADPARAARAGRRSGLTPGGRAPRRALATLEVGNAIAFSYPTRCARPPEARLRVPILKEILFATILVPTPEGEGGTGAVRGCRSDRRT